jgi:hypothetical protein
MKYTQNDLANIHKLSFGNEERLRLACVAGCFSCLKTYPTNTIDECIEDNPTRTACCPHCDVDSVLADKQGVELNPALLKQMQDRYFHDPDVPDNRPVMIFASFDELNAAYEQYGETHQLNIIVS